MYFNFWFMIIYKVEVICNFLLVIKIISLLQYKIMVVIVKKEKCKIEIKVNILVINKNNWFDKLQ